MHSCRYAHCCFLAVYRTHTRRRSRVRTGITLLGQCRYQYDGDGSVVFCVGIVNGFCRVLYGSTLHAGHAALVARVDMPKRNMLDRYIPGREDVEVIVVFRKTTCPDRSFDFVAGTLSIAILGHGQRAGRPRHGPRSGLRMARNA